MKAELKEKLYEVLTNINTEEKPLFIAENDEEPVEVLLSLEEFELMLVTISFTLILKVLIL